MKKNYIKLFTAPVGFETVSNFLSGGSKTSVSVKVNEVTVEDYQQGFGTPETNDFKEIDFN